LDISNFSYDQDKKLEKKSSKSRSKASAYSYISEVGGKIEIHKTWSDCEKRVKGIKARYKKALNVLKKL
jgi:viroplasmin and RNaseH domain-containing protein